MAHETLRLETPDGIHLFVNKWVPTKYKAVVQIAHGMAEHSDRYSDFAKALNMAGYAVYANDHRGHGKTAGSVEKVGFFAESNGWELAVKDQYLITAHIKAQHKDTPVFLFGHSMGSLLFRTYLTWYSNEVNGAVFSGTAGDPGLLGKVGLQLAKVLRKIQGAHTRSKVLDGLTFGAFNKPFKPNRTPFDWLSRDNHEVDKYIADPYCGDVFTTSFFCDMLWGVQYLNTAENIQKIRKDIPLFIFSGEKDPVGEDGKGVVRTVEAYQAAGIKNIEHKLYTDARHEMLNETNRTEVYLDVVNWLDKQMPASDN